MSKSKGNVVAPQSVIKDSGADILRLWVAASDYADDLRIGPEIIKTFAETYRKLRNTLRWMLGSLAHRVPRRRRGSGRHAGAGAADPAPAGRARRRDPRGLRGLRHQAGGGAAQRLHDRRPVVLLLRRPQGRALLRSDLLGAPPGGAPGDRRRRSGAWRSGSPRSWPSRPRRRGSTATRPRTARCISRPFPTTPADWRDAPSRSAGTRSGGCGGWSPAPWRSSAPPSASARAWRRRRRSTSRIRSCWRRSRACDFADICITSAITVMRGRGPGRRLPARRGARRRRGAEPGRGAQMRPLVAGHARCVGGDPDYPDVTPATPRPCASGRAHPERRGVSVTASSRSTSPRPRERRACLGAHHPLRGSR